MVISSGFMGIILGMIIGFVREKLNNNDLKEKVKGLKSIIIINIKEQI